MVTINVLNIDGSFTDAQAERVDLVPEYAAYVWQKRRDEWKVIDPACGGVLATGETEADERRYWDATQRHMWAVMRGEDIDPDSGLTHLSCATANLLMLAEIQERRKNG